MPSQDIVLGLYYATRERSTRKARACCSPTCPKSPAPTKRSEVELHAQDQRAHQGKDLDANGEKTDKITRYETTVGRALLSEILPAGLPFALINKPLKKKEIFKLINAAFRRCGLRETVIFADKLMGGLHAGNARRYLDLHRRHAGAEREA